MTEPNPLAVAVVGAGYFAQFHYDAWSRIPEVRLAALVEPDSKKAQATATQFRVPATYPSIEALLEAGAPDLLDIVTPPETHRALVATACRAVPTIICQKPLAPSLAEAEEIVAIAREANRSLIVHENFRFQPWYREAKRLVDNGTLGTPHGIAFRLRPGDGQGPKAYLDRQPYFQTMPRFLIHETGVHFVDTFRYLVGEVTAVTARLRRLNPVIAGEDAGTVVFEFANGASGLFDGNRLNDHEADNCRLTMGEMHLEGARGVLRLDGRGRLWFKPHGQAEGRHDYTWPDQGFAGDCVNRLCGHVVAHLREGAPLENDGESYLANLRIVEAIYRSHDEGRCIAIE